MRVLPTTTRPALRRRTLSVLLLPLLFVLASIASASPAAAVDSATKPVGSGASRYLATVTWLDNRPTSGTGHPAVLDLRSASGTDCNSSQVVSVWVHRIQAGTENVLASGRLNDWNRCPTYNHQWWLDRHLGGFEAVQPVSGCWTCDYNLWSGPGGSPGPTNKQALRVFLYNSSGQQIGLVTLDYPG